MSQRKKGGTKKPARPAVTIDGKTVPEGSPLHNAVTALAELDPEQQSGAACITALLSFAGTAAKRLAQMQAQLDRIEGRVQAFSKPPSPALAETAKPAAKQAPKPGTKPSRKTKADVSRELAELEETVEQRQARMAKMEKDEKRKALALKKKQDEIKAKKEKQAQKPKDEPAQPEAAAKKKRPRRRRKTAKKEGPTDTA